MKATTNYQPHSPLIHHTIWFTDAITVTILQFYLRRHLQHSANAEQANLCHAKGQDGHHQSTVNLSN
jgi:hypothetical protein